jgi:hypothetical protein
VKSASKIVVLSHRCSTLFSVYPVSQVHDAVARLFAYFLHSLHASVTSSRFFSAIIGQSRQRRSWHSAQWYPYTHWPTPVRAQVEWHGSQFDETASRNIFSTHALVPTQSVQVSTCYVTLATCAKTLISISLRNPLKSGEGSMISYPESSVKN